MSARGSRSDVLARHEDCYKFWVSTDLSQGEIARRVGFRDASSVAHGVRAHASRIGRPVARVSELRRPRRANAIDRARLAFLFAAWVEREGHSISSAAAALGCSRVIPRKISNACGVDDESLVLVLMGTGIALEDIVLPARADAFHGKPCRNRESAHG